MNEDSDQVLDEIFGSDVMEYLWRIEKDALKSYVFGGTFNSVARFFKISKQAAHNRIKKILKVVRFYQRNIPNLIALEVICELMESDENLTKDEWLILRDLIVHRKTGLRIAKKYNRSEGWVSNKLYRVRDKIRCSTCEEFSSFVDEYMKTKELRSTKYVGRKKWREQYK
jgi:predicted DNA-binding protein YlxM (UPF0122 family)